MVVVLMVALPLVVLPLLMLVSFHCSGHSAATTNTPRWMGQGVSFETGTSRSSNLGLPFANRNAVDPEAVGLDPMDSVFAQVAIRHQTRVMIEPVFRPFLVKHPQQQCAFQRSPVGYVEKKVLLGLARRWRFSMLSNQGRFAFWRERHGRTYEAHIFPHGACIYVKIPAPHAAAGRLLLQNNNTRCGAIIHCSKPSAFPATGDVFIHIGASERPTARHKGTNNRALSQEG